MSKLDDIKGALESYNESMDLFDEASADGEPNPADYEYRDDDAVRFATDAAAFITLILPHIEALAAARKSLAPDTTYGVFKAVDALVTAVTASHPGTEEEGSRA